MQSKTETPTAPINSIRLPKVREMCGNVSAATVWSWSKHSDKTNFPRPYKLSQNCTVWSAEEIQAWLQSRIAASRAQQPDKT